MINRALGIVLAVVSGMAIAFHVYRALHAANAAEVLGRVAFAAVIAWFAREVLAVE